MFRRFLKIDWVPYGIVVSMLHLIGLAFLLFSAKNHPMLMGFAFISYTLGMRHAFDADHIAAIDNTIRKLVQQKENPVGVGFYFSLGHSSIVFIMSLLLTISVKWAMLEMPQWQEIGAMIGMTVSGVFLVVIGVLNLIVLLDLKKVFYQMRDGNYNHEEVEELLLNRGVVARFAKPLFKLINKSWHVYPIGFLFGLGFDTASEVALFSISAGAAQNALPVISILSLPILFAAGMSLFDTADGVFMTKAYNWAFSTPLRKVYYNLTITTLSVVAALFIGVIELIQIFSEKLKLEGTLWNWICDVDIGMMGYGLVVLFLLSWLISFLVWRYSKFEERWSR